MTTLTPEQQAALEQLRDIRLPDPVGWWPLAPGWWALAALLLLAATALIGWMILRRRTRRFQALRELEDLRNRLESEPADAIATELAALVRRVALVTQDDSVARLSDADWVKVLSNDKIGFPGEVAGIFADLPYRRADSIDKGHLTELFKPTESWIRRAA